MDTGEWMHPNTGDSDPLPCVDIPPARPPFTSAKPSMQAVIALCEAAYGSPVSDPSDDNAPSPATAGTQPRSLNAYDRAVELVLEGVADAA